MIGSRSTLRNDLRASSIDGSFHAAMVGFGETYFAAFALLLGASPFQVGLLATVPMLVGAALQPMAPRLAARFGAKRWVIAGATLQGLVFLPTVVLALRGATPSVGVALLMVLVCVYWALGLGINAVWGAWMGCVIPTRVRVRYFARRMAPIHTVLFVSMLVAGTAVHFASRDLGTAAYGFAAIFVLAGASRLASAFFLGQQSAAPLSFPLPRHAAGAPAEIDGRPRPYRRLILLAILMNGAVNVASPFFTPFMLVELHLSYGAYTLLNAAAALARIASASYWGEIARLFGNRRVMQVSALLIVPLPALWLVSSDVRYLFLLQMLAGFSWAGYDLTVFLNFFDCTDESNRARVLSAYNLYNGFAVVGGTLVGGWILREMPVGGYFKVFLASALLRSLVVLFFARGTGVRRPNEHSFENVLLRVVSFRPGQAPRLRPEVLPESPVEQSIAGGLEFDHRSATVRRMKTLERFMAYASDFELSLADDQWDRIKPYFAEDAVYEIDADGFSATLKGADAITAGMKKSLDGFDRKFDTREIEVVGQPEIEADEIRLDWLVNYRKEGYEPFVLRGRSTARFQGDAIIFLGDRFDPSVAVDLAAWRSRNDLPIDPSYT